MSITLSQLLHGLDTTAYPPPPMAVSGICLDSRRVERGDVFFAYGGEHHHGTQFVDARLVSTISALVVDEHADVTQLQARYPDLCLLCLPGLRRHLSGIAARFYGNAGAAGPGLSVVGITGTNGKTSSCQFLAQSLSEHGVPCYVMGTIGNGLFGHVEQATLTTPDPFTVQRNLAHGRELGAAAVVMEVSSHALQQYRVGAVPFQTAVYTNLSRDHLDFHGDMAGYAEAKRKLFNFDSLQTVVMNWDDEAVREAAAVVADTVSLVRVSLQGRGDVNGTIGQRKPDGFTLDVESPWGRASGRLPLLGDFNACNALLVIAVLCRSFQWPLDDAMAAATKLRPVPGRLEHLGGGGRPHVVIDYAHTPDALEKVLAALRDYIGGGNIICVFGCGGDRDRGKRSLMGKIAAIHADRLVITDDNPRTEPAAAIVEQILQGVDNGSKAEVIHDRAGAIRRAICSAAADDIVVIAGKGHEDYQLVGERRLPFSDFKQAQAVLQESL